MPFSTASLARLERIAVRLGLRCAPVHCFPSRFTPPGVHALRRSAPALFGAALALLAPAAPAPAQPAGEAEPAADSAPAPPAEAPPAPVRLPPVAAPLPPPPPARPLTLPAGVELLPDGAGWRIHFAAGAESPTDAALATLAELGRRLAARPQGRITLFAQASGPATDVSAARRLSLARALAVKAALAEGGLPPTRIDLRPQGRTEEATDAVDVTPPEAQRAQR